MKAFCKKPVTIALLLLTLGFAFSSCGDDAMWTESRLVGIWHTRDNYGNSYTQVKFFEDGTGMIEQYDYGRLSDYFRGRQTATEFTLTITTVRRNIGI